MQIHKIVLTIIDFDEIGAESCREVSGEYKVSQPMH
jgi:hypothetical protein